MGVCWSMFGLSSNLFLLMNKTNKVAGRKLTGYIRNLNFLIQLGFLSKSLFISVKHSLTSFPVNPIGNYQNSFLCHSANKCLNQ